MTAVVWNDHAGDWQSLHTREQAPRYQAIAGCILKAGAASVLDIGCGEAVMREYLPASIAYTGIEPSAIAAERARSGRGAIHHSRCEEAAVSGPFDAIVFNEVLYYLDDPMAMLEKFSALLAPDGVLIVSIYQKRVPAWRSSPNAFCTGLVQGYVAQWERLAEATITVNAKTWWLLVARRAVAPVLL